MATPTRLRRGVLALPHHELHDEHLLCTCVVSEGPGDGAMSWLDVQAPAKADLQSKDACSKAPTETESVTPAAVKADSPSVEKEHTKAALPAQQAEADVLAPQPAAMDSSVKV